MTDREAKWIALECVRASLIIEFSRECIDQIMPPDEISPLMIGDKFWFAGIEFVVLAHEPVRFTLLTRRCGGRPFTQEEAMTGHFRMSAIV